MEKQLDLALRESSYSFILASLMAGELTRQELKALDLRIVRWLALVVIA